MQRLMRRLVGMRMVVVMAVMVIVRVLRHTAAAIFAHKYSFCPASAEC
jgi:hypothetical protein